MSNYTITTDFGAKDSLPSSNSAKVVRGSEFTTEFTNIQTAIATKADTAGDTFTGVVNFSADVAVNTNTLFVDVSEAKVGIGTTTPSAVLDVTVGNIVAGGKGVEISGNTSYIADGSYGTSLDITHNYQSNDGSFRAINIDLTDSGTNNQSLYGLYVNAENNYLSGNVGIGTTNPIRALHVNSGNDTIRLQSTSTNTKIEMVNTTSTTNEFGFLSDSFFVSPDGTEAMRIKSSGNVGIGTTSPATALHIDSSGATALTLQRNSGASSNISIKYDGVSQDYYTGVASASEDFVIGTSADLNGNNLLRVTSAGNVGIGTTSPQAPLHVHGDINLGNSAGADAANVEIASLNFYNRDTSNSAPNNAAIIRAYSSQATGSGGYLTFATSDGTEAEGADATEKMRIDSSGKVGIGTTSPASTVHIQAPANALQLNNANEDTYMKVCGDRAQFGYRASDGYAIVQGAGSKGIAFGVNNATFGSGEAMRIRPSGKLVIGKTDESVIDTVGIEAHPIGLLAATRDNNIPLIVNRKTAGGVIAQFRKDNTTVGDISVTASATSYNTSSDERLKENIADSADAGSKVDAIQIRQFDWKADGSHQDYGVIAQELVTVAPEAVFKGDNEEDMMGVDYSKLVPMLIKEIQSLRSRVAELENA